jgi:hypothetical protein
MRGDPRVYNVRITMTEEYESYVIAPDARTAKRMAERGEYSSVWATGRIIRRTVHEPRLERDMTPEDVPVD